jgi:hypothetical protein
MTRDPIDDLIDAALARQRARIAADLRAEADRRDGADRRFVAGLRAASELVRGGRGVDVPR